MSAGYTDLHNHTLPGVDDGAKETADAVAMAERAAGDGISTILLTPHNRDVAALLKEGSLKDRVQALRAQVEAAGVRVKFLLATENYLEPALPARCHEGLALTVNGTRYILVEFPYSSLLPVYAEDVLFQLQLRGLTPIIVHPERCDALVRNMDALAAYVKRGMLVQITAGSLAGLFGSAYQKAALETLQRGLVHVIATDAHRPRGPRKPIISEGLAEAARIVGEERAKAMASTVPAAIVAGKPVPR